MIDAGQAHGMELPQQARSQVKLIGFGNDLPFFALAEANRAIELRRQLRSQLEFGNEGNVEV